MVTDNRQRTITGFLGKYYPDLDYDQLSESDKEAIEGTTVYAFYVLSLEIQDLIGTLKILRNNA